MSKSVVSKRTWLFAVLGVGLSLGVYAASSAGLGGESVSTAIADVGEALILVASAALAWWAAMRYEVGEPLRRRWMMIAAGVTMFAIGDVIWAVLEAGLGQFPYPSWADIFYLLTYVFIGPALLMTAASHRGLIRLRTPIAIALSACVVIAAAIYLGFLGGIAGDGEMALAEKAVSIVYPLADAFLLLGPALMVALIASRLGSGLLARPWWLVALGCAVVAFADTGMSWLATTDSYDAASILNAGWMIGFVMIAVGASLARDIAKSFEIVPAAVESPFSAAPPEAAESSAA